MWDYCVDDPVGKYDPTGLISAAARFAASSIGSSLGGLGVAGLAFPPKLGEDEMLMDINKQYKEFLTKARSGEELSN